MTPPNDFDSHELTGASASAALARERWVLVRGLVETMVALPRDARTAFLDASCGRNEVLRHEVERLVASYEQSDENSKFLAQSAGELAAPLVAAADPPIASLPAAFCAALADRYVVGAELGRGGMATVYVAEDLRHQRRVAIKVLDPDLGAMLGADRFLAEIRVTANLQHPNLLPLFDSGAAHGLLYYVMPLVTGATLRTRLHRERQLPVDEAVRITRTIAGALDYAHRQGIVHRDLKPENILLQDGEPLVADFGIALAVVRAGGTTLTVPGISLGTPQYMSPEQAAGDKTLDGRSDVYSLACVLYEMLAGDPPFTGSTAQAVIARMMVDKPSSVRTVRSTVPPHVDVAITRALAKVPADRHATAREFADALVTPNVATISPASAAVAGHGARRVWWRDRPRLGFAAAAVVVVASAAWLASRTTAMPAEVTRIPFSNLIDQTPLSSVTITPNGRALVYTGTAESGRPIMMLPLDELTPRALPGTNGGYSPFISPDGHRMAFFTNEAGGSSRSVFKTIGLDGVPTASVGSRRPSVWRYGNAAWTSANAVVTESNRGLAWHDTGDGAATVVTRPDTARGEFRHLAPLVLPGGRAVVFTISTHGGLGLVSGPLAIAAVQENEGASRGGRSPHVLLGIEARRAVAFVDGWLLFTNIDGLSIMAVRLDVARQRIVGTPVVALRDDAGNLETGALADNGTLLYVRRPKVNVPVRVDSGGTVHPLAVRAPGSFMYPRVSPDNKRIAMQANTAGDVNDVWVYDLATGTPTQFTTSGRALHPTWAPNKRTLVYMAAGRRLMSQPVDGSAEANGVTGTDGGFGPSVAPDGSIVYQRREPNGWIVWSVPAGGAAAPHKVIDDTFAHYMPAVSPDGHWLADVSSPTGHNEVYARPFPGPGPVVQVSDSGGTEPAWSPDGRQIYYRNHGAFMAVNVATPSLAITSRRKLFKDTFDGAMPHRNYDVMPDGSGFLMITGGSSEAVVVLNWVSELRARLAKAR
jgi:eukaryotic-like serine/threonine-protein kinase